MTKIKKILELENIKQILIILIASIFICLPLLNKNLNISYDDGIQHICRLMGTYQSMQEGQIFPVIMSNFCNGFGYSWNLFYSPLTAYIPLIFKIIGFSFIDSLKIFIFFVTFLSGLSMYFFTKEVTKNKKIATLAGLFYIFAPYRFTDMYLRNALAELTSFVFLPMVFNGLYGILKEKPKKEYLLIMGSICLLLTHTIITMYVAIICFIYLLINIKKLKNKNIIKKIILCLIFIVMITSFFWAPLLEHKLNANYEVFKEGRMERTDVLIAFKLNLLELFITPKNNIMIFEIGILSILLLVFSPIVIKKILKKYKNTDFYNFYLFSLIIGLICIFMTLKIFPFEHLPKILKMLQFSFRLLEFSSFFFAFVVAVNIEKLIKNMKYKDIIIIMILLMLSSTLYISHLHYTDNLDENKLWPVVPVTENTGRVHAGCASFEYLPSKAFENRHYIETRSQNAILISGFAQIENEVKNGSKMNFDINYVLEETTIELPYIYYLGYDVTLKTNDKNIKLETFETDNGFVGIKLPILEEGKVEIKYAGTVLMNISNFISVIGVCVLIGIMLKRKNQL